MDVDKVLTPRVTALKVLVEVSLYDEAGKIAGRQSPEFVVMEADIPAETHAWVAAKVKLPNA